MCSLTLSGGIDGAMLGLPIAAETTATAARRDRGLHRYSSTVVLPFGSVTPSTAAPHALVGAGASSVGAEFDSFSKWFEVGIGLSGLVGGFAAGMALMYRKRKCDERKAIEEAAINGKDNSFQAKHTVIHETLTTLRIKTAADRARIGHFHNGGRFLDGTPMKKFSITHESCDRGIPYDGANFQNILVTMFWDLVRIMRDNRAGLHWAMDMEEGYFRSYINSNGIAAYSVLPIMKADLYTGFIILEWFDAEKTPSKELPLESIFTQSRDFIELELALR